MSKKTPSIHWTREEFLAYLLLYAAHIDVSFEQDEREYIVSKIEPKIFERILQEFSQDNDYDSLQKIIAYQKQDESYSAQQLLQEIKSLFLSDDHFHPMEQQMMAMLRMLFK